MIQFFFIMPLPLLEHATETILMKWLSDSANYCILLPGKLADPA